MGLHTGWERVVGSWFELDMGLVGRLVVEDKNIAVLEDTAASLAVLDLHSMQGLVVHLLGNRSLFSYTKMKVRF